MNNSNVRVRFAPSPTGMMHLGNVRAALLNYLFAKKHKGTFILRVEDTDTERNSDPSAGQIRIDLSWLGLDFDEGPEVGGPYAPYFQSERSSLYLEKLRELAAKNQIYRCFCTVEELEKRRQRQIALKMPPRYDRTCFKLTKEQIDTNLAQHKPYIWRLITAQDKIVTITDLAHGKVSFNLKELSDLPLTRNDGSFTFIFANCIDDITMRISHIIRGEDHLTNTAGQIVLYNAFEAPIPVFWHLPIICNAEGKKLSKRDFGFSLNDLRNAGFLPEAICNYLGIIGGSFEQEVLSLDELAQVFNFENMHSTGHIRYDIEKLKWMNHKWINRYNDTMLAITARPFLEPFFNEVQKISDQDLGTIIKLIKTDIVILTDLPRLLLFYFKAPTITQADLSFISPEEQIEIAQLIEANLTFIKEPSIFVAKLKEAATVQDIKMKNLWWAIRVILTGAPQGMGIQELIELLGSEEADKRIRKALSSYF